MFYGVYEIDGEIHGGFYDYDEWYTATWSPDTNVKCIIDLKVHGKTYAERKDNVIDKAHDFEDLFSYYGVPMSWEECSIWSDYFTKQGKRYGLLREFRENAIC